MDVRTLSPAICGSLAVVTAALFLAGCAGLSRGAAPSAGAKTPNAAPSHGKVEIPDSFEIEPVLRPGQSWKSRFVSTSEVKQSLSAAGGKAVVRSKAVGLELVATQTVKDVTGDKATIEVNEASAKILQDGRFLEAPFRRFHPPNPVTFTIDLRAGTADFSKLEKAYAVWMDEVKAGPAGEILGKSFRLDAYVAQLAELYGKPFLRFARKTLSKEPRRLAEKAFFLPFLGPGSAMGPVPVEVTARSEGFEVKEGIHTLVVAGELSGEGVLPAAELSARLADLGRTGAKAGAGQRSVRGSFRSSLDLLSGREIASTSQVAYTSSASLEGETFAEEVAGKLILEPAD